MIVESSESFDQVYLCCCSDCNLPTKFSRSDDLSHTHLHWVYVCRAQNPVKTVFVGQDAFHNISTNIQFHLMVFQPYTLLTHTYPMSISHSLYRVSGNNVMGHFLQIVPNPSCHYPSVLYDKTDPLCNFLRKNSILTCYQDVQRSQTLGQKMIKFCETGDQ